MFYLFLTLFIVVPLSISLFIYWKLVHPEKLIYDAFRRQGLLFTLYYAKTRDQFRENF